jgi:glutamyl-tRNA(Gln) amidotransferase subunit D
MKEQFKGYKGKALKLLEKNALGVWDIVELQSRKGFFTGIILPRNQYASPDYIEIKLENNYNVGINVEDVINVRKTGTMEAKYKIPEKKFPHRDNLMKIKLLGTGGTVASRLDYTTGAVIPSFTPQELFSSIPELSDICNLECEIVFELLSENMKPEFWQKLAQKVKESIDDDVEGIIIAHGTDTMAFTGAALSFMLQNLPIPVVLTGSQRSSDRPSSDAALNLIHSAIVATSDLAEVVMVMMGSPSHEYGLIHRGTLARKMHSSIRNAFRTIDDIPLGMVERDSITMFKNDYKKRDARNLELKTNFENKIAIIYSYPGMDHSILDFYIDKGYKGMVLAGTGLGHVPTDLYESIKVAIEQDIIVLMTTQTIHGFVGMNVYSTGRDLQNIGVISGRNMLPETAYVKLGWVLGQTTDHQEIHRLIATNIAGELLNREIPIAFNYNIDELIKEKKL